MLGKLLSDKAKKKLDEEYSALIKDVINDNYIKSLVSSSICDKLHNDLYNRSGMLLFPQIYIPHFQYLEDNGLHTRNENDTTLFEEPLLVFYSGDARVDSAGPNEVWPGYKLINGQLQFYTMVDEEYANLNTVWVYSINETFDSSSPTLPCEINPCRAGCPLPIPCEYLDEGCGGGGGGGCGTDCNNDEDIGDNDLCDGDAPAQRIEFPDLGHNKINFKIQYMRVRHPKESWLAGSSEISIKAKLVCHNGRDRGIPGGEPKEYSSDQYSNRLEKLITKVKQKDVKNQTLLTVNYPMQRDWQNEVPSIDPVHFVYIMFERDVWPAKLNREVRYAPQSPITGEMLPRSFKLYYRSGGEDKGWNLPYADFRFTNTLSLAAAYYYAGSGLVENGSIAFNTVLFY